MNALFLLSILLYVCCACGMNKNTPFNKNPHIQSKLIEEEYDRFYYSQDDTKKCNDREKNVQISPYLLIHLLVEAAATTKQINKKSDLVKKYGIQKEPFQELQEKLQNNNCVEKAIKAKENYIYLTEKDLRHRLLSYIRCNTKFSWVNYNKMLIEVNIVSIPKNDDLTGKYIVVTSTVDVKQYSNHQAVMKQYNKLIQSKGK